MPLSECDLYGFLHKEAPHLKISLEDLKNPKPEVNANLYRWFVLQIFDCRESAIDEIQADIAEVLEYQEHCVPPVFITQLVLCLDFILTEIGCNDKFVVLDIINPTRQRTLFFLSALVDFYLNCKENNAVIDDCLETEVELAQEKEQLISDNDRIKERIATLRVQHEERQIGLKKVMEQKMQVTEKCQKQRAKMEAVQEKIKHMDAKSKELEDICTSKKTERDKLMQRCQLLSGQVMTSPEKRAAQDGRALIAENRLKLDSLSTNVTELRAKLAELPKVERMLDLLAEKFDNVQKDLEKHEQLCAQKDDLVAKISQTRLSLNSKSRQATDVRESIAARSEKLSKLSQKLAIRMKDLDNEIVGLKRKIEECEIDRCKKEVTSIELDEEHKRLKNEFNVLSEQHQQLIALCTEKRERLFAALDHLDKAIHRFFSVPDDDDSDIV